MGARCTTGQPDNSGSPGGKTGDRVYLQVKPRLPVGSTCLPLRVMTPWEWDEADVPQPVAQEMEGLARSLFDAVMAGKMDEDRAVQVFDEVFGWAIEPAEGNAVAA